MKNYNKGDEIIITGSYRGELDGNFIVKQVKSKPIYEQVLLFAGTLLPNEKIIVSKRDFGKILSCRDEYGYPIVNYCQKKFYILHIQLERKTINNFPRAEFGDKRTNRNFELKDV
jgi:hypothetical protein